MPVRPRDRSLASVMNMALYCSIIKKTLMMFEIGVVTLCLLAANRILNHGSLNDY